MKDQEQRECTYNNAKIRVHFPDRAKEEQTEIVKKATKAFLKKVIRKRKESIRNDTDKD